MNEKEFNKKIIAPKLILIVWPSVVRFECEDPSRTELAADEANANVRSSSPPPPNGERHIPKFIPLDEDNWVASNKFRRLPPGASSTISCSFSLLFLSNWSSNPN